MTPRELKLSDMSAGTSAVFEHVVEDEEIDAFAELSGDNSPLHMDPAYARERGFRDRVAHGALLAAFASQLIGTELPGRRALLLNLNLEFPAPTYAGDTLEVAGTVKTVHTSQRVIRMAITIRCEGEVRARGSALVRMQDGTG